VRRLWPHGGLWRHPDFLRLWGSQSVSQVGTQISLLALPLAAILTLEASAFEVAMLSVMEYVPWLVLALPTGVWVDRAARRPLLIAADYGRAVALGSVPVVYLLGGLSMWQLYAVALVAGALTVFFDVAYMSYLPSLVGRDSLVDGNAKLEVSRSVAQVAGPGLGGVLVSAITAPYAIAVDAVSFVGSALLLTRIRAEEDLPPSTARRSMRHELAEGLRYLVRHPYWRPITASTGSFNLFQNISWAVILVYAVRQLDMSAGVIGLVFTLSALGGVAGAAVAPFLSRRLGVGPAIVGSAAFCGVPMLLLPLAPADLALPFFVVGLGVATAGIVVYNISAISLMQALTPERLLGRMNACRRFVVWGTVPLGALIGGVLASTIGVRPTIFVGTILGSLAFLPVALSPVRRVRELPREPEADTAPEPPLPVATTPVAGA
jgi:MFS family permease